MSGRQATPFPDDRLDDEDIHGRLYYVEADVRRLKAQMAEQLQPRAEQPQQAPPATTAPLYAQPPLQRAQHASAPSPEVLTANAVQESLYSVWDIAASNQRDLSLLGKRLESMYSCLAYGQHRLETRLETLDANHKAFVNALLGPPIAPFPRPAPAQAPHMPVPATDSMVQTAAPAAAPPAPTPVAAVPAPTVSPPPPAPPVAVAQAPPSVSTSPIPPQGRRISIPTSDNARTKSSPVEYIEEPVKRHIEFSKRKASLMKKAHELSVTTGTEILLLVTSESGIVYTFSTRKFQPMVTPASDGSASSGQWLIQQCLGKELCQDASTGRAPAPAPAPTASDEPPVAPSQPEMQDVDYTNMPPLVDEQGRLYYQDGRIVEPPVACEQESQAREEEHSSGDAMSASRIPLTEDLLAALGATEQPHTPVTPATADDACSSVSTDSFALADAVEEQDDADDAVSVATTATLDDAVMVSVPGVTEEPAAPVAGSSASLQPPAAHTTSYKEVLSQLRKHQRARSVFEVFAEGEEPLLSSALGKGKKRAREDEALAEVQPEADRVEAGVEDAETPQLLALRIKLLEAKLKLAEAKRRQLEDEEMREA
ncbi:hypothetical protein JCM10207_008698 [Rhodosporidiobolus poonsookiae]